MRHRSLSLAVALSVVVGGAIDARAQATATITGSVTTQSGIPLTGQLIGLYNASSNFAFRWASTDNAGQYTLSSLPPGTYYLATEFQSGLYVQQIYGTSCPLWRCTPSDGTPIVVTAGQTVSGVDFLMRTGGTATGVMFDAVAGAPIQNLNVQVRVYDEFGNFVGSDFTVGSGDPYQVGQLSSGRYYALAQMFAGGPYISELSDGRHCGVGCPVTGGTPFTVTEGAQTTVNFTLDMMGRIAGRVTSAANGQPAFANVYVESLDRQFRTSAGTNSDGRFEIAVPPGTFTVLASTFSTFVSEFYGGVQAVCDTNSLGNTVDPCANVRRLATPVTVGPVATTSGIDIALDAGGSISGGLTVAGPVSGSVQVRLLTPGGLVAVNAFTFAPAIYTVSNVPPGRYYVCVTGTNFRTQAYGGLDFPGLTCPPSTGVSVNVTAGATTSSIDFTLQPALGSTNTSSTIKGAVRDSQGNPVRASIRLISTDGLYQTFASTAMDGTYSVVVPAMSYFVRTEAADNFIDEWYGNVCVVCGDSKGTSVTAPAFGSIDNVNFELAAGGTISGSTAISGIGVGAYDAVGRLVRPAVSFAQTYSINGLPSGTYYLRASTSLMGASWPDTLHPGLPCRPLNDCPMQDGAPISVVAGQTTGGVDIVSAPIGGVISGRVKLAGAPVDGNFQPAGGSITVEAFDTKGNPAGYFVVIGNGLYEIRGLPAGTYYVRTSNASRFGAADERWQDDQCSGCPITDATPIVVTAASVTRNIDFELEPGGTVRGRVVDAGNGRALDNARVELKAPSGELVAAVNTMLDGSYVFDNVARGTYFLEASTAAGHLTQRYRSLGCVVCEPGAGMPIVVGLSAAVTGIDFTLVPAGRVSGRVLVGETGLVNATVSLVDGSGSILGRAVTDFSGTYIASARVGVAYARTEARPGYLAQIFDRQPCPGGTCNFATATQVPVQANVLHRPVDFALSACSAPALVTQGPPASMVSSAFSFALGAMGAGGYRFSIVDGVLPAGVTLNPVSGVIAGTLTVAGSYRFTAGVTDAAGCGATRPYAIEVKACGVSVTPAQLGYPTAGGTKTLQVSGACSWQASTTLTWATVSRNGTAVSVTVQPNGSAGARYGAITVGDQTVDVTQAGVTSGAPFGTMDIPANNQMVSGAIAVGGWALDDLGVTRVHIYRDAVGVEPGGLIYLGDAVRVPGARPDVEVLFPQLPDRRRAGWGFLLLTNTLPNGGNGTYRVHAYATDVEGYLTSLGARTIVVDNASATKPFGTIDTPAQGETIAGPLYLNFGWALTQTGKMIPFDGSTITVLIDGLPVGSVDYNHFRSDIAALFPGRANSNGAVGFKYIDTTGLTPGLHTISWVVTDSLGVSEGLGSRYFILGASPLTAAIERSKSKDEPPVVKQREDVTSVPQSARRVRIREMQAFSLDVAGLLPGIDACPAHYSGAEIVKGERRALPVGTTFDEGTGLLNWQPGPGFIGTYHLVFTIAACEGSPVSVPVDVTILPIGR